MRKLSLIVGFLLPFFASAQLGLKGGVNFANVTNASSINSDNQTGFLFGFFFAPPIEKLISFRSEVIYSRQGYNFQTSTNTGEVNLDYILLPQLMCINLTKFVQLQAGAQMAFLVNAKADSTTTAGVGGPYAGVMDYYNKFDYGFALGGEVHPIMGLLVGARWNISLGKLYKDLETGQNPSFTAQDAKNNVIQVFTGWQFGKKKAKEEKKGY